MDNEANKFTLVPPDSTRFSLCSAAERRMEQAIKRKEVLLINDTLLLKFRGILTAFAIADTEPFKKEHWYSPFGSISRQMWRDMYARGILYTPEILGKWIEEREVQNVFLSTPLPFFGPKSLLKITSRYARRISPTPLEEKKARKRQEKIKEELTPEDPEFHISNQDAPFISSR